MSGGNFPRFFTSAQDEASDELHVPDALTPGMSVGVHCIGGRFGCTARQEVIERGK
jgi:hypothetical protein